MMSLEHQVCTQPQAQTIDELFKKMGVEPPESYFVWIIKIDVGGGRNKWQCVPKECLHEYPYYDDRIYRAYSCAELGVMLPAQIEDEKELIIWKSRRKEFHCWYEWGDEEKYRARFYQRSDWNYEAHAKAALLIHLLEQKIIKPENLKL